MLELFQITGSASFAARAALEEAGAEYTVVNVHPRRRDETHGFVQTNPLRRVPALGDGDVSVYETGAVLLYLVERLPGRGLGPAPGEPGRGDLLRWVIWLANTLHAVWHPITAPHFLSDDPPAHESIRVRGLEGLNRHGAYLEAELEGREWCLGDRFSVADLYLYMLKGWESYARPIRLGGERLDAHYRRVGDRPAIRRTRALDGLDERLQRHLPELRDGMPL